jgi:hypothetical protein
LLNKVAFYDQVTNANLLEYRDSTEELENRIFVLENALVKKDNLFRNANKKLNKLLERQIFEENARIEKETYVNIFNL